MKTRVPLFLILFVLAWPQYAVAQAQPESAQLAAAWSRYTYPGEEFSVELPSMPQVFHTWRTVRETPYEGEKVRVFGIYASGVVYMLIAFDKPRSAESDEKLVGPHASGMTPKDDVKLGSVTGREYEIGQYTKGTARFLRTERHAYLLKAFSNVEGHGDEVGRFLNSFTLGAKPAGKLISDDAPTILSAPTTPASAGSGTGSGSGVGVGGSTTVGTGAEAVKPAPPAGVEPYRAAEVTRKALVVYKPEPGFTEEARRNNVTGVVRLRAIFSPSGKVTNVSVIKGLPDALTEKAVEAARHILFFPAMKDGREVSQYVVLEYNFNIY